MFGNNVQTLLKTFFWINVWNARLNICFTVVLKCLLLKTLLFWNLVVNIFHIQVQLDTLLAKQVELLRDAAVQERLKSLDWRIPTAALKYLAPTAQHCNSSLSHLSGTFLLFFFVTYCYFAFAFVSSVRISSWVYSTSILKYRRETPKLAPDRCAAG